MVSGTARYGKGVRREAESEGSRIPEPGDRRTGTGYEAAARWVVASAATVPLAAQFFSSHLLSPSRLRLHTPSSDYLLAWRSITSSVNDPGTIGGRRRGLAAVDSAGVGPNFAPTTKT